MADEPQTVMLLTEQEWQDLRVIALGWQKSAPVPERGEYLTRRRQYDLVDRIVRATDPSHAVARSQEGDRG